MSEDASIEPIEPSETLYTLEEAKVEMNRRQCAAFGHDLSTVVVASGAPVAITCTLCGLRWSVVPL